VPTEILAHTSSAQFVPTVLMLNAIRTPRATSLAPLLVYDSTNELWVPFGFFIFIRFFKQIDFSKIRHFNNQRGVVLFKTRVVTLFH